MARHEHDRVVAAFGALALAATALRRVRLLRAAPTVFCGRHLSTATLDVLRISTTSSMATKAGAPSPCSPEPSPGTAAVAVA